MVRAFRLSQAGALSVSLLTKVFISAAIAGICYPLFLNPDWVIHGFDWDTLMPFGLSALVFVVIYVTLLKPRVDFAETFVHEATHMLVSILCGHRPEAFVASRQRGEVTTSSTSGSNWLVSLAPYSVPLVTILFLALSMIVREELRTIVEHLAIISFTWHLITVIKHFSFKQRDIRKGGILFSPVFIAFTNLALLFIVVHYLQGTLEAVSSLGWRVLDFWEMT